jgi:sarcosine oxidase subunit gamma
MSEQPKLETPLHYLCGESRGPAAGLLVVEAALCRHLSIRGGADSSVLQDAVRSVAGLSLPTRPLSCERSGPVCIFWQGPTEWMLVTERDGSESLEEDLRRALEGESAAVVDVSGGQTLLTLTGPSLPEVLQMASPYDFHPAAFPVGKCVQTVFAKTGALVARVEDDSVLLLVRRSFADYVGSWLLDAAAGGGVRISADDAAQ